MMKHTLYCIGDPEDYRKAPEVPEDPIALAEQGRLFETVEDAYSNIPPQRRLDCVVFEVEVEEDSQTLTPLRVIAPFSQHNIVVDQVGVIPPQVWININDE